MAKIGATNRLPFNPITWPAVPHDHTGDNNLGYYTDEATQRYVWGTRGLTWEGKVFKYSRNKGILWAGYGACNGAEADVSDLINSDTTIAIAAGDKTTTVTLASDEGYDSAGAVAENELVGAHLVIGHGGAATTETRTVVGNTVLAAGGGTTIVEVDFPWALAHAAGFMEMPLNPYGYCIKGNDYASVVGVPNIVTTTTNNHIWLQTWGPCWCVPGGATRPGDTAQDRTVVWTGDGSTNSINHITAESGFQIAGFAMDASESGTEAMPLVMLQISI